MEKLTLVEVAPRWEGDAGAVLGWPDESWDEYATACVEHVDLHPAPLSRPGRAGAAPGGSCEAGRIAGATHSPCGAAPPRSTVI